MLTFSLQDMGSMAGMWLVVAIPGFIATRMIVSSAWSLNKGAHYRQSYNKQVDLGRKAWEHLLV